MRPSSTRRASAPRSRTTSTRNGVRSARLAPKAATISDQDGGVDQHARAQHAAQHLRACPSPWRGRSAWRSGSGRAGSSSCPSRSSQTSMQAAQPMHSYCRPLRMSMPVGQTCTHSVQSMQSPRPSALRGRRLRRAREPRGSPRCGVVADDQRVLVEHRALEARVRAHVLADLLAHEAGVAVGGEAVEQHPEPLPRARSRASAASAASVRIGVK